MKIRDLILAVLIIGMVVSTGALIAFTARGINDIKGITSESSSEQLMSAAGTNLQNVAMSIADSLDSQMQNQYRQVKSWAKQPNLIEAAKKAQIYSKEDLYEMWSAKGTRKYSSNGEAIADGDPNNDLVPAVSRYLTDLSFSTSYPEIFITDSRGYVIAASGATSDFDQGPDDWRIFLENGVPVFKKYKPAAGGEGWYKAAYESPNAFYVSGLLWDESAKKWGIEIVCQIKDEGTDTFLGEVKAVMEYDAFILRFVNVENLEIYETKIVDQNGIVVTTSLKDKTKINNPAMSVKGQECFKEAKTQIRGNISTPFIDENGENVCVGWNVSSDVNRHIVMVTNKVSDIAAPINSFIDNLQSKIGAKSTGLQTSMIIFGVILAVVIIVIAFFIIRAKISIPLKKLKAVSDKLSQGEITGLEIDVQGKDEIGSFGESFKGVLAAFHFLKEEAEKNK